MIWPGLTADVAAAVSTPGPLAMAGAIGCASGLGALLAFVYRRTAGAAYNPDIAQAQIALAALMAMVMLVVGDHLSRAFGAVGVLSVMRFRVKMQGAAEATTLLGAVAVGMAAGVGMYREALAGALCLSLLAVILAATFKPAPGGPVRGALEED